MRFFTKVKLAFYGAVSAWKGSTYDFSSWLGKTFWGVDNSKLASNETIFSIVSRLSNSVASLPLKLYHNYDSVMNQTADVVINNPNPNMTGFEFIRNMETVRNEKGNAYALIERDFRMMPVKLTVLNAEAVEPVIEKESEELWYQIRGERDHFFVHNSDMVHVKHIVGNGGVKGIDPIKVLTNTSDYDKAVREFSLKEMQSAPNSFILKYGANVDKEKRQRIIDDFKRFYRDNGGVLFQETGVEIDKIERKYIAADTFASERITRSRVANVYNTPVTMLNDTEGQSYSSNEQLMRMFAQLTLGPIIRQYEQEFNKKLLSPTERSAGYYFKFNIKALLRADTATQMEAYSKGIRSGIYSQDEVRQWEDLPPHGGNASKLWVSGDLYPIDLDPVQRKGGERNEGSTRE